MCRRIDFFILYNDSNMRQKHEIWVSAAIYLHLFRVICSMKRMKDYYHTLLISIELYSDLMNAIISSFFLLFFYYLHNIESFPISISISIFRSINIERLFIDFHFYFDSSPAFFCFYRLSERATSFPSPLFSFNFLWIFPYFHFI